MTIREVANQLYNLSVDGQFNGERLTKTELERYINNMFRPEAGQLKIHCGKVSSLVMTVVLPDKEWYFTVDRYGDKPDCFGYFLPEDEAQETRIINQLFS